MYFHNLGLPPMYRRKASNPTLGRRGRLLLSENDVIHIGNADGGHGLQSGLVCSRGAIRGSHVLFCDCAEGIECNLQPLIHS